MSIRGREMTGVVALTREEMPEGKMETILLWLPAKEKFPEEDETSEA